MEGDDGDDGNDGDDDGDDDADGDDGVDDDIEWSQLNLSICFFRGCGPFRFFFHALGAMTLRNVDGMAVDRTRHEYSRRGANNYVNEGARTYAIASNAPRICVRTYYGDASCRIVHCVVHLATASGYMRRVV